MLITTLLTVLAPRAHAETPAAEADITPIVLLQAWGTAWDQDVDPQADSTGYGDPEADAGVSLKRARLGVEGTRGRFDYKLVFGLTSPYDGFDKETGAVGVVDATIGFAQKGGFVEAGRTKVPFSRDQMMSAGELTFQERGFGAEHVAPDRALGLRGGYKAKGLQVQGGVFNSGGTLAGDDNDGKTYVGRVEYNSNDTTYRTWTRGKAFAIGVGGGGFLTDDVATRTVAFGGDVLVRYQGVYLLADVARAELTPQDTDVAAPGVWADTTRLTATGQLGVNLGRYEPAVRWTMLDDSSAGKFNQVLAGVTWHGGEKTDAGRDSVRFGLGYVKRLEETERDNDTVRAWAQVRY